MKRIIIFILLFQFASYSQNADINLLRDVNLNRNRNLDNLFRGITYSVYVVTPAVPLAIGGYGLLNKNSIAERNALFISTSLITVSAVSEILKYTIKRPRPSVTYHDIENVTSAVDPSFPSGHTSLAFSMATSVSLAYPKWYVIVPSFIWAGAVGYSRMDLGVHYPTDVLVGAVLGTGSAFLCHVITMSLVHKKK